MQSERPVHNNGCFTTRHVHGDAAAVIVEKKYIADEYLSAAFSRDRRRWCTHNMMCTYDNKNEKCSTA